jgi:hypothetical protein
VNETLRDRIKRRIRWITAIGVGGWLLMVLTISTMGPKNGVPPWSAVAGFILMGGAVLLTIWTRCPKCKERIGQEIGYRVAFSWRRKPPDYCPYCGTSLDQPCP